MNPASIPDDEGLEELTSRAADEFMVQVDGGAAPDVEEFAGRHPQIAGVLRRLLPALRAMRESDGASARRRTEFATAEPERLGRLGDFEIMREVGRGGMGVVYEAVQISLGRRVALKVLPFAAMLDPQRLQRFQNEARAAACLHHGNIVPVFAVGADRGVHFYAMQYIEGRNLADLVHEMRLRAGLPDEEGEATGAWNPGQPAERTAAPTEPAAALSTQRSSAPQTFFRTTAELAVQAAQALHHAHQEGVVHRDVKPANLMVDAAGHLWVTDFGLAQVHNDPRLTTTGALVGTLRYMSPEQASGDQVVDHRTDLYSLGATLYEVLTLRPVFDCRDRGTLLRQITQDEPLPPRRLNPSIPADLETIVGKAMAKSPADRYPTAQALADDLRRFLEDKPIRAKRPTLLEKAAKWARRRRGLAAAAVGLLLLTVCGLTVSTILIARAYDLLAAEQRKTEAALQAEAVERKRSEDAAYKARQVLNFFTQVSEEDLPDRPELRPVRRKLLEKALDFYKDFIEQESDNPSVQDELTASRYRAESLLGEMGARPDAIEIFGPIRERSRPLSLPLGGLHPPPGGPGGPPFRGPEAFGAVGLLAQPTVRQDLKLSDEQAKTITALADKRWELIWGRRGAAEEAQRGADIGANETASLKVLHPEQAKRLRQIVWQRRGPHALNDPEVADALNLTTDQKEYLHGIEEEIRQSLRRPPGEHRPEGYKHSEEFWKGVNDRLMSVLSDEQKAKWKELTGEPFQGEVHFGPPSNFGPPPHGRPPME
jgi:eukaryotic-like serine/threonine-protein kinase